ncbi:phosphatase [Lentibacillus kapialis]|uniref:Phosphatase n=1 Tax=Lentibacillus kapialis TaxID=340214 RepID=A0A917UZN8_9BACI|nr:Cof-type HAD-IIB family hydrolase [Lentibacillus kapialis]GGK00684.1 phosphatase [Lentibacillus kapialis]
MDKKVIFFDIDGTLLDRDKKLPTSTKQAILHLKQKGHEVVIATGRSPFMFKELREELDIDSYVSFNGQYVVVQNEVIYKNPLDKEVVQSLTDFASRYEHPLLYVDHADMRANIEYHPYIEKSIGTLKLNRKVSYDPTYYQDHEIYQSNLFCVNNEETPYINAFGQSLRFIRWHPYSLDILPAGGSKAKGIDAVVNRLNHEKENIYAFGDALNDIEMLQMVDNGVAMGNSPDSVKKSARYVTKGVNEDGIAYGLELVGLL